MAKKMEYHYIALSNSFLQSTSTKETFRMNPADFFACGWYYRQSKKIIFGEER